MLTHLYISTHPPLLQVHRPGHGSSRGRGGHLHRPQVEVKISDVCIKIFASVGLCTRWWTATGSRWSAAGWSVCATARGAPPGADTGGTTCAATPRRWPGALKHLRVVLISNILLKGCISSVRGEWLLLNVLKLQLNLSPCCIAPTMLHLHPPLTYWCSHALSQYQVTYVTTELLMITCSY